MQQQQQQQQLRRPWRSRCQGDCRGQRRHCWHRSRCGRPPATARARQTAPPQPLRTPRGSQPQRPPPGTGQPRRLHQPCRGFAAPGLHRDGRCQALTRTPQGRRARRRPTAARSPRESRQAPPAASSTPALPTARSGCQPALHTPRRPRRSEPGASSPGPPAPREYGRRRRPRCRRRPRPPDRQQPARLRRARRRSLPRARLPWRRPLRAPGAPGRSRPGTSLGQ
mmetsp:Transcript_6112/g.25520  ORF Transcript_6112/g.25520 Transcript_6112/m.25520 type:complete len:225 (+) Transcript_6112:2223-2897(+)